MDSVKGAAIAAAVASMMGAGGSVSEAPLARGGEVLLCDNSCKGKSACKAGSNVQGEDAHATPGVDAAAHKNNTCKGANACKGLGVAADVVEWDLFDAVFEI